MIRKKERFIKNLKETAKVWHVLKGYQMNGKIPTAKKIAHDTRISPEKVRACLKNIEKAGAGMFLREDQFITVDALQRATRNTNRSMKRILFEFEGSSST